MDTKSLDDTPQKGSHNFVDLFIFVYYIAYSGTDEICGCVIGNATL